MAKDALGRDGDFVIELVLRYFIHAISARLILVNGRSVAKHYAGRVELFGVAIQLFR
jgi:hypothetical protein